MQTAPPGRNVLALLLVLNGGMFVVELVAGFRAESMGLIADGLDMGADAAVYLLALLAVGASAHRKLSAARFAGVVQFGLAALAAGEIGRRILFGSAPESDVMIGVSLVALAANVTCLALLRRHRHGEVHLQAAWIFSATDVQANLGVMLAGALVALTGSAVPDLVIGLLIVGIVLRGAIRIWRRVQREAMTLRQGTLG